MPETKSSPLLDPLLDRLPGLQKGKMPPVDPKLNKELASALLEGGKASVAALIDALQEVDDGSDWKARFLLHSLVNTTASPNQDQPKRQLAGILLDESIGNRPAPVRTFLLLQLRLIADKDAVPKLVPLLASENAPLADAAAAVLVTIGKPARKPLTEALKSANGRQKDVIINALAQIP